MKLCYYFFMVTTFLINISPLLKLAMISVLSALVHYYVVSTLVSLVYMVVQ